MENHKCLKIQIQSYVLQNPTTRSSTTKRPMSYFYNKIILRKYYEIKEPTRTAPALDKFKEGLKSI